MMLMMMMMMLMRMMMMMMMMMMMSQRVCKAVVRATNKHIDQHGINLCSRFVGP